MPQKFIQFMLTELEITCIDGGLSSDLKSRTADCLFNNELGVIQM